MIRTGLLHTVFWAGRHGVYWGLRDRHTPKHLGMSLIWDYGVSVCCGDIVVLRLRCLFQLLKVHGADAERCQELGRRPAEMKQHVLKHELFQSFLIEDCGASTKDAVILQ